MGGLGQVHSRSTFRIFLLWAGAIWLVPALTSADDPVALGACDPGPCVLLTASSKAEPSVAVREEANLLADREAQWVSLPRATIGVPTPVDGNDAGIGDLTQRVRTLSIQDKKELIRAILVEEFLPLLPKHAYWQADEVRKRMRNLCINLLQVVPEPEWEPVANTCMRNLPQLRQKVQNQEISHTALTPFLGALATAHDGLLRTRVDERCTISVGAVGALASNRLIETPLPGEHAVIASCPSPAQPVVYRIDAYSLLEAGVTAIELEPLARQRVSASEGVSAHLHYERELDAQRLTQDVRALLREARANAAVVVVQRTNAAPETLVITARTPATLLDEVRTRPETVAVINRTARISRALGVTGGALVAAAWGVSAWYSASPLRDYQDSLGRPDGSLSQAEFSELESKERAARPWPQILVAAGATASLSALLASRARLRRAPRWVSWLAGGAGLGLLSWAVADLARTERCQENDTRVCARDTYIRQRAGTVAGTAVPLLATPFIVAPWLRANVSASHVSLTLDLRGIL